MNTMTNFNEEIIMKFEKELGIKAGIVPKERIKNFIQEQIEKKIDEWVTGFKTSWKYMKRKGFPEAEEYGDCIFLDTRDMFDVAGSNAVEELKLSLFGGKK